MKFAIHPLNDRDFTTKGHESWSAALVGETKEAVDELASELMASDVISTADCFEQWTDGRPCLTLFESRDAWTNKAEWVKNVRAFIKNYVSLVNVSTWALTKEQWRTLRLHRRSLSKEVQQLALRGNVTREEYEALRINTYERWLLYPALTDGALASVVETWLLN